MLTAIFHAGLTAACDVVAYICRNVTPGNQPKNSLSCEVRPLLELVCFLCYHAMVNEDMITRGPRILPTHWLAGYNRCDLCTNANTNIVFLPHHARYRFTLRFILFARAGCGFYYKTKNYPPWLSFVFQLGSKLMEESSMREA